LASLTASAVNNAPPAVIYRCDDKAGATFSDTPRRCADGQTLAAPTRAASKPVTTVRLTGIGSPCPLTVDDPEGPVWTGLRACYTRYMAGQKNEGADESQLAGAAMGQCDVETRRLVNASSFKDELGVDLVGRRQSIHRWAQWLARDMGKVANTVPVDLLVAGKPVSILRLSGPTEQQLPDGSLSEVSVGSVISPHSQIFLRRGTSLTLGGATFAAGTTKDRCVRVE
jgi:hypothetical protein